MIRKAAPNALDFTNRCYRHRGVVNEREKAGNRTKSKVRAKVEHCSGVLKRVFGFSKVRYRICNGDKLRKVGWAKERTQERVFPTT